MLTFLSAYDFSIEHRAGRLHSNCDALSRRPCFDLNYKYCERVESKFPPGNVTEDSSIGEECSQKLIPEVDRQNSEEISENNLVDKVGMRKKCYFRSLII